MNLLRADFYRLVKDKAFYVLIALTVLMPLLTCIMFPDMTVERLIFQGLDATIFCSVTGISIALFVGKDYANNTIRNKICYGENRLKVMTATFVECAVICLVFVIVSTIASLVFGCIFGEFSFTVDFAAKYFCQICILLAFSVVVAAITMCTKNIRTGLVVTLMVSIILSAIAQILPMLAVTNELAAVLCRIVYATVSSNLLNSVGGTYVYTKYSQTGIQTASFGHLYLNALLLALVYAAVSFAVTFLVVKRQSYK